MNLPRGDTTARQRLAGIIILLLLVTVGSIQIVRHEFEAPANSNQITHAQFSRCDGANSLEKKLPDNWRSDDRTDLICGRYVVRFDRVKATEPLALLIPTYRFHVSATLNGQVLGESEYQRNQIIPFHAELPERLLAAGTNRLTLELKSDPIGEGFLDKILIGSADQLDTLQKRMYFWRVWLPQALALVIAVFGFIALLMFATDVKRKEYLYFGLFSLSWVIHMTNLLWMDVTIPTYLWTRIVFFAVVSLATFGCLFASEFLKNVNPMRDRALLALWVAWGFGLFFVPQHHLLFAAQYFAIPYSLLLGFLAVSNFFRATNFNNLSAVAVMYLAQNVAIIVVGIHDVALTINYIDASIVFYLHYVGPTLVLCIGAHMLLRYVTLLRTEQSFSGALQAELTLEREELQSALARERVAIENSAAQRERDGLMRDLHDSVGARLVSLVHLSGGQSASGKAAQETLDELRFMTTPLRIEGSDITVLLANFREKRLHKLEESGLDVQWHVEDIDAPPVWNARQSTEFLRVLDEMLANTLKHGSDKKVKIALINRPNLRLNFSNPASEQSNVTGKGVGLHSLQLRCERIGASFNYKFNDGQFIAQLDWY